MHESEDREDLIEAVNIMADVAAFINESKRRKDIVDKYKTEEEKTLTRKISKLNMHSIGKKSTRIGQRFLSSIGIESSVSTSQTKLQSNLRLCRTTRKSADKKCQFLTFKVISRGQISAEFVQMFFSLKNIKRLLMNFFDFFFFEKYYIF